MEVLLPASSFLIVFGSLMAIIGTQLTGKARGSERMDVRSAQRVSPLGRGKAVMAGGWFIFLLGFLGIMAGRLI